jgi:hypothetical protein
MRQLRQISFKSRKHRYGGKVKLSLCLIYYATGHEDVWGNGGRGPSNLTSVLDEGEWLASRPGHFAPGTHWIGGCVGPRAVLNAVENNLLPLPRIEPWPSRSYPVAIPTELSLLTKA